MTKKSIDVQDEIEKIQAAKPVILKCSYSFHRKIKKERRRLTDPLLISFINTLTIKPVGTLPDHIILLCDANNRVLKMINLTARSREKPIIIH